MRYCAIWGYDMGEIADMLVDQMMEDDWHPRPFPYRPPPRCRICGVLCYWAKRKGGWVLMSNGVKHKCPQYLIEDKALKGFTG